VVEEAPERAPSDDLMKRLNIISEAIGTDFKPADEPAAEAAGAPAGELEPISSPLSSEEPEAAAADKKKKKKRGKGGSASTAVC